jgi:hypothetical protein
MHTHPPAALALCAYTERLNLKATLGNLPRVALPVCAFGPALQRSIDYSADGWCWFVLREEYCWLVVGGWCVLREKYCWLVADKPSEQGACRACWKAGKSWDAPREQHGTREVKVVA